MLISSRTIAAFSLSAVFLFATAAAHPQKSPIGASDRERERRSLAVNLVRAINAAEANYKKTHGIYATWDAMIANEDFTDHGTKWAPESFPTVAHAMYGSGAEIVPGWKLRLQISKDGNAYDLLLEDVTDPKCGFAVISDERGLVRQGKSVDCAL